MVSKKTRRKLGFPRIREVLDGAQDDWTQINKTASTKKMEQARGHEELVKNIVDSIENKRRLDRASYDELVESHPQVKKILDELIHQVRLYSIYDDEPTKVNYNYGAYLKRIDQLVRIGQ